jgi:hypothetical protein
VGRCRFLPAALLATSAMPLCALAQPDASFRASCGEVRAKLQKLRPEADSYFAIQVVGEVKYVGSDAALAYLGLCGPPDPRILCVTYTTGDWKMGDTVMVTGIFSEDRPDYIKLDPCLHSKPGGLDNGGSNE